MFYEFDDEANALYIRLKEEGIVSKQIETEDGVILDVDNRGWVLGIEIISPETGWSISNIIKTAKNLTDEEKAYIEIINEKFHAQRSWEHFSSAFTPAASSVDIKLSA